MTQPDPRSAVLRAAGHTDAADILDQMAGLTTPAGRHPEHPEQPEAATQNPDQAQGQVLLDALRASGALSHRISIPFNEGGTR